MVQNFMDNESSNEESLQLPPSITSAERDQIRQICKHFDLPFKVFGEGTEKYMVIRRPDYSYFANAEKESMIADLSELDHWRTLAIKLAIQLHKDGACSICEKSAVSLDTRFMLIKNCGHIVCENCGQSEQRCRTCNGMIGELVTIPEDLMKAYERDKIKRIRR